MSVARDQLTPIYWPTEILMCVKGGGTGVGVVGGGGDGHISL